MDKYKWIDSDTNEPFYALYLELDPNNIMPTFAIHPKDMSNANGFIYTIETWDTTTIRASVGQYLVSKYISQNTDAKVLFVGEGPDEVCSSYLFN